MGRADGTEFLRAGDEIRVPPFAIKDCAMPSEKKTGGGVFSMADLEKLRELIIHDDADIVAFFKPAGLATQGGTGIKKSLDKMAAALFPYDNISLVHRLDRETSGIIVCAKNAAAAKDLSAQFSNHTAHKQYIAMLRGNITQQHGTMDTMMTREMAHDPDDPRARRAITRYKILDNSNNFSWVEFSPLTGRNHQLRLHAAQVLNAPIVGDPLFPPEDEKMIPTLGGGMFLCATRISLRHPRSGKIMTLTTKLPEFMYGFAKLLGAADAIE